MADINIIYKEIEQLSQKSTISGAEKIVVSDTEYVTPSQIAGLADVSGKQDTLVSGVNIKTINNLSILGSGNLNIEGGGGGGGSVEWGNIGGTLADQDDLNTALAGKQATLVSGTNIKTINNQDILGSGNITISGGGDATWGSITGTLSSQTDLQNALNAKAGTDVTGSLANLNTTVKTNLVAAINEVLAGSGGSDNPLVDISVPTPYDGTLIFEYANGDTTTVDLNHQHPQYPSYYLCEDQDEYDDIVTKDAATLYLIPETSE